MTVEFSREMTAQQEVVFLTARISMMEEKLHKCVRLAALLAHSLSDAEGSEDDTATEDGKVVFMACEVGFDLDGCFSHSWVPAVRRYLNSGERREGE